MQIPSRVGVRLVYPICPVFWCLTKVSVLTGNHECREIQLNFTFHKECVSKFGEELGEEVWEAVNKVTHE